MSFLIAMAIRQPRLVLSLVAVVLVAGIYAFLNQPVDAYPDISPQMVQVITPYPGRAPEEVERQVTIPLEFAMGQVPRVEMIRSRTIFGLSKLEILFEEGVETYWARQRVQEKLAGVTLPSVALPELGPLATAYGEVFRYELLSDGVADLMELRTLNDWVVIPRLMRSPGVAEVSNFGGHARQFGVILDPYRLKKFGVTLHEVVDALQSNNSNAGGSVIPRGSMSFVIRGRGSLQNTADIAAIFVKSFGGTPIRIRDVATVELEHRTPTGIFSKDSKREGVEGIILMRRGENPSIVIDNLKKAIKEINETRLPEGVKVSGFYDRTFLVDSTMGTVKHSVLIGIALVVLVLLVFQGSPSMAGMVAATIPFSLLFALFLMYLAGIPIGLLSIGAIDFGIIVDGAVIMADHVAYRLGRLGKSPSKDAICSEVAKAASEVQHPVFFSMLMIIGAYLPILTLTRIEGLLFRPMAITIAFALIGALLFSLFVVPVLCTLLLRRGFQEWENPLLRLFRPVYGQMLRWLLQMRWLVMIVLVVVSGFVTWTVVPTLGIEFLPYMDEGVIWVRANFPEGTSIEQNATYGELIRKLVLQYEDVNFISLQAGRSDSGLDPFPPSRMEIMIGPRKREEWTQYTTKQELIDALGKELREEFPTTRFSFTQPIIDSVTEDTNGTSADLAVQFTGLDSEVLRDLGRQTVDIIRSIPGATDVAIEQEGPQPQLVVEPDRALCARYNVRIENVNELINTALGGEPVGELFEGERRFEIVVKYDREYMKSPQAVARLPVYTTTGVPIPLGQVATIRLVDGQTLIARENGKRRITVRCDISGRDQGSFVDEAQRVFKEKLKVPDRYEVSWLGMFQNLQRARDHFMIVLPVTVVLIYILLVTTLGTHKSALVVMLSVPFAFIGGAVALSIREMHLNVSAGVGFTALFGIAIMNGVLVVERITARRAAGMPLEDSVITGSQELLRAVLMASLVAMLGLLPASLATGLGSDVQRPLATVIIWGLFSSTALTLFIVPVFYCILKPKVPVHHAGDHAHELSGDPLVP
ncbi:MAG: heavy metal efflux pump, CzcA family [Planctomycetaceae bacterium]|nr:heavy metal efflux pump, CzcA family [Planctomycetaceae bacterium]